MSDSPLAIAAEIALGLRPDTSATTPELAAAVRFWEEQFLVLNAADDPVAPSDGLWDAISQRIDEADSAPGTRSVPDADGVWEQIGPGITRKVVHVDQVQGAQCYFVRMDRGAVLPTHAHHLDEHCVVLKGTLRVGEGEFGPGTYHFAQAGMDHVTLEAVEAAEFFVFGAL